MNSTIDTIKNHRSIRSYKDQPIDDEKLDEILKAAQSMPNSINGQQVSVIVVKNKETRSKIAQATEGNPWIVEAPVFLLFLADFYKTEIGLNKEGVQQVIHESIEGSIVGAVDVGLNMAAAIISAESLGLGIVPIGGVRRNPQDLIELLKLPPKTFPICGLAIGYPKGESAQKPRLSIQTYRHDEAYKTEGLREAIDQYDDEMEAYYKNTRQVQFTNWSKTNSRLYQKVYYPNVYPTMKKQGFLNDK